MIKGWKKLTKSELRHLKENKCNHTVRFQLCIDEQAKLRKLSTIDPWPCWDCGMIAKKLGMTPEVENG